MRETEISNAVSFLTHASVRASRDDDAKRGFLKGKGVREDEIDEAFRRAGREGGVGGGGAMAEGEERRGTAWGGGGAVGGGGGSGVFGVPERAAVVGAIRRGDGERRGREGRRGGERGRANARADEWGGGGGGRDGAHAGVGGED